MNKSILVIFIAGMVLLSLAAVGVHAQDSVSELENDSVSENHANETNDSEVKDVESENEDVADVENETETELETELEIQSENGKEKVKEKVKLHLNGEEVETELESEKEDMNETEGNQTKVKVKVSNGFKEVKIMPSTASARALEVLGAKCEERNCTIELKEVGQGNETRAAYEVKTEKQAKILGLFKAKMKVEAQVDAETGEVISKHKPWWAFLATEEA